MKIRFLFIVLLQNLVSFAQPQKDFKPDYIIDRFFAVKEGGLYYEVKPENGSLKYGRAADSPESLARLDNLPEEAIVPVSSLRKVTADEMLEELQSIQFNYAIGENSQVKIALNFLPYDLAVISGADMDDSTRVSSSFYNLKPETIAGYTILNLYNFNSFVGGIYPLKKGYKLRMFSGYGNADPVMGKVSVSEILQQSIRRNFPFTEVFNEDNAYGLRLQEGKNVMIPPVYDSIKDCNAMMVAAYSGKKVKLFYRNGDLALDGIRAFQPHSDRYTVILKGNNVFYIDNEGALFDKLPQHMEGRCGTVPHYTDSIVKMGGCYKHYHIFRYGGARLTETVLAKVSDFKDIRLINGSTISRSLTTAYYSPSNTNRKGYIVTLNSGAKSIIEINKDGTYKLSLEPDNYTFVTKEYEMDIPLRFKSNGLYGYWPQNNSARYKELSDFDKGFARFTLPDGTMGWLANNGSEYMDE